MAEQVTAAALTDTTLLDVAMHQIAECRRTHGHAGVTQKQVSLVRLDHDLRTRILNVFAHPKRGAITEGQQTVFLPLPLSH